MAKVKHIAFFRFKEGVTPEQVDTLFTDILDMTETVDGVEDYVAGTNNSPEGLNQGYTHAFIITFSDVAARDAYLVHADHQRVKEQLLGLIDGGAVVDFEV